MAPFQAVQASNALVTALPVGLVALFIGGTSGIGQATLQHLAAHGPPSSRIYTVARASAVPSHSELLVSLRQSHPSVKFHLIEADISLVSQVDHVVNAIKEQGETKLDILFMSAGFLAFTGRVDTAEGLDPSMSTRYYSRLRAVQQLLPLLTEAGSAGRVVTVLAGGSESPFVDESDLDLRDPKNWSFMAAARHTGTMTTLALERLAQENPRLSAVHWSPGPVATRGLERGRAFGFVPPSQRSQEEAGAWGLFLATSDRYAVQGGGTLVPVPDGLDAVKQSGRGIFLINSEGDSKDNEVVLGDLRERGIDEVVWRFTQQVYSECIAKVSTSSKEEP